MNKHKFLYAILAFIAIAVAILAFKFNRQNEHISNNNVTQIDDSFTIKEVYDQTIPECDFNGCPEYKEMDVDGDGEFESIIYKRIAMTKDAGEVLIVDNGKVDLRIGGAGLSYKQNEDTLGITVSYVQEFDETGLNPKVWANEKWIYIDGKYILYDDYSGFCDKHIETENNNRITEPYNITPKYPDFDKKRGVSNFKTVISRAIESGANFAGYYTVATWGCGTDCFGYSIIDLRTGEIIDFSPVNENYNIGGFELRGRYLIMRPVTSGQLVKYYKLEEYKNYSGGIVNMFNLICTETSIKDVYGSLE